jgi:hypothetical protein
MKPEEIIEVSIRARFLDRAFCHRRSGAVGGERAPSTSLTGETPPSAL